MTNNLEEILKQHNCKVTRARILILQSFSNGCHPLNAEEIYKSIKKTNTDKVTVYRTLALFDKNNIIKKVNVLEDSVYYELNSDDHHHIICSKCHKTSSFTGCHVDNLINSALKQNKNFKTISSHSIDLFGICTNCSKK